MKKSWLFIAMALSLNYGCGEKPDVKSDAVKSGSSTVEAIVPVATVQSPQSVAEDTIQGKPTPATGINSVSVPAKKDSRDKANIDGKSIPFGWDESLALASKSGCLACHKIESKLIGPAWQDVSKRYKGNPEAKILLIGKVKAGGKGNWSEVTGGMPMPPNSPRVSDENIEKLVSFILSL